MAYLTQLPDPPMCRRRGCHKKATHMLYTWRNERMAEYCQRHGEEARKRAEEDEQRHFDAHPTTGDAKERAG